MHLRRLFPLFFAQAVAAAAVLGGCIIQTTGPSGGVGGGDTGTSSTSQSSAGTGGAATSSSAGTGGTMCVGASGLGSAADCDKISISPKMGAPSNCGATMTDPPPGYSVCVRGYTIFTTGAADDLDACLAGIAVQSACDLAPVQSCVDKMFADACNDPAIAATCADIGKQCGADPFDVTKCTGDLKPFSNAGLQELETCINNADPMLGCQAAFNGCYDQVLTF